MATTDTPLRGDPVGRRHRWRARAAAWSRRRWLAIGAAFVALAIVGGLVGYNILLRIQHYTVLESVPAGSTLPVPATPG